MMSQKHKLTEFAKAASNDDEKLETAARRLLKALGHPDIGFSRMTPDDARESRW